MVLDASCGEKGQRRRNDCSCRDIASFTLPGYRYSHERSAILPLQLQRLRITVIAKTLVAVAIAFGANFGLASVASADPSPFGNLSCSCHLPPGPGSAIPDQVARGIEDGLSDLQATHGHPAESHE